MCVCVCVWRERGGEGTATGTPATSGPDTAALTSHRYSGLQCVERGVHQCVCVCVCGERERGGGGGGTGTGTPATSGPDTAALTSHS